MLIHHRSVPSLHREVEEGVYVGSYVGAGSFGCVESDFVAEIVGVIHQSESRVLEHGVVEHGVGFHAGE